MTRNRPRPRPDDVQRVRLSEISVHPSEEVIGVDEVGFGAWAGPLVVGGVVFPKGWDHPLCRDSKSLSHRARQEFMPVLKNNCLGAIVVSMEAAGVDVLGAGEALALLTAYAVDALAAVHPKALVVLDGAEPIFRHPRNDTIWLPKADALVPAVSAASILAKTTRDDGMVTYDECFPGYGFASNKGYHSAAHVEGLEKLGPSLIHRLSYSPLKKLVVPSDLWEPRRSENATSVWMSFPAR